MRNPKIQIPNYLPSPKDPVVFHRGAEYHDLVVEDLGGELWTTIYYHGDVVADGPADSIEYAQAWLDDILAEHAEAAD